MKKESRFKTKTERKQIAEATTYEEKKQTRNRKYPIVTVV